MKKWLFFFLIYFFSSIIYSQSNVPKFNELSAPKKWWVIFHPFKAKKTVRISNQVIKVADSIAKTKTLDGDRSGGQVDAFRHAFWMASLRIEIGKYAARSLGKAHEKENFQYFKENKLEDGIIPDKASMDMDLYNNDVGLSLVKKKEDISKTVLIIRVINAIREGKMKIIKKNNEKEFLTCEGEKIEKETLKRKWINAKCLIPSHKLLK